MTEKISQCMCVEREREMSTTDMATPAAASRTRPPAAGADRSELRGDSCYFPGCRKDTNCHCEICLASIKATRDLIPSSSTVPQSSLSKLSVSRPTAGRRTDPVPFDPESPPSTPQVGSSVTPAAARTPDDSSEESVETPEEPVGKGGRAVVSPWLLILLGLPFLWAVHVGFWASAFKGLGPPKLTPEAVKMMGEEARVLGKDLKGRLEILQRRMEAMLGEEVSNCSSSQSRWELNQDGLFLFQWRCSMYKSMSEKVTIWGSPLRTAGLLTSGSATRSMTLLSGKIVEWSDGRMQPTMRASNNSSWSYAKWSSAALQLDEHTWVLEYERSSPFLGRGVPTTALETLRLRASNKLRRLKAHNLRLLASDALFGSRHHILSSGFSTPPT